MADALRLPLADAVSRCGELGADGLQVYAVRGEMAPEAMSPADRMRFRERCRNLGLEIAALCGDLGGHGFQLASQNPSKVARSKAIVDLAADLGTRVVTTHIGVVPPRCDGVFQAMRDACRELGDYAASRGVSFAVETGPEPATTLAGFLEAVDSPGLGVNLDPANLVMVCADDPVAAVFTLGPHIVHTHAKDGIQIQPCDPVRVYGAFAEGGFGALVEETGELFREVPLGQGAVDWPSYLEALTAVGFKGFLTIEREVGDNPEDDIRQAIRYLRNLLTSGP